ncbi:uncharacterized protein G2W53_001064 [Senna tora]|uniref:Uncharacterized protein n=1 Tax=Senna tora TaxID=362788 RepID=A0A834XGX6_9FABA|nr:uncharacterized protein G2W53_001064 [Senna tora]
MEVAGTPKGDGGRDRATICGIPGDRGRPTSHGAS